MVRLLHGVLATIAATITPADSHLKPAEHPPERQETALYFYDFKGKLKLEPLNEALAELGCSILRGPEETPAQRSHAFVTVQAPGDVDLKLLGKALKKGKAKVMQLAVCCFDGREGKDSSLPSILGLGPRDHLIGMDSAIRWYESRAGYSQFYYEPKKLKPEDIQDRYEKLYDPFGGGTIGELVTETFTWSLEAPVDPKAQKKALKAIEKLASVEEATIDTDSATLTVKVALTNMKVCGPPLPYPLDDPEDNEKLTEYTEGVPRVTFATNTVLEALEEAGLALTAER